MRKAVWFIICMAAIVFVCGPALADSAARKIDPPAGDAVFTVAPGEPVEIRVNTTPHAGHIPAYEWFVLASSRAPGEIFFMTPEGMRVFVPGVRLLDLMYPYSHTGSTEMIDTMTPDEFGLSAGDTLYYAYVYVPAGEPHMIIKNIVSLQVQPDTQGIQPLQPFASASDLEAYLKDGIRQMTPWYWEGPDGGGVPVGGTPDAGDSGGSPPAYSGTNLQEAGVDEADRIKTDGTYLYVAPANQHLDDWWGMPVVDDGSDETSETEKEIRILRLSDAPPSTREIETISLADHETAVDGMYLLTDREENRPDLLVTIGGQIGNYWGIWYMPWYWQEGVTEIVLYDVDTPRDPEQITRIEIDGFLVSSRRIDDTLYLVTRYTPMSRNENPPPEEGEDTTDETPALPDLLPSFRVDGEAAGNLVEPDQCYRVPVENRDPQPTIITITAIDLNQPDSPVSRSVVGPTETVYMSTTSLYLATTLYKPGNSGQAAEETTDIHKFALEPDGPAYHGSGSVPGTLGWEEDKKPFRMSAHENILRVTTSLGNTWDDTSSTRLTLLKEIEGPDGPVLTETAAIDGIGETGERLYAVRYAGKYAYLVTFRITDPLYIFDLSDPENPFLAGELHIDGYSDYLHPVSETLLLGIGKDAVPDTASDDFGGRGAWYQGVKLSLFDISDPTDPQEIDSVILGKRGTESDALYDHHALAWLPATEDQPARLALPVRLHNTALPEVPNTPWAHYGWTHTGLYLFDIETGDDPEIDNRGRMIVAARSDDQPGENWWYGYGASDRAVLLGDSVHYVHADAVWSASWGLATDMVGPE